MSKAVVVQVMYTLCVIMVGVGLYLTFGLGIALVATGVIGMISFLTLPDVDEKERK